MQNLGPQWNTWEKSLHIQVCDTLPWEYFLWDSSSDSIQASKWSIPSLSPLPCLSPLSAWLSPSCHIPLASLSWVTQPIWATVCIWLWCFQGSVGPCTPLLFFHNDIQRGCRTISGGISLLMEMVHLKLPDVLEFPQIPAGCFKPLCLIGGIHSASLLAKSHCEFLSPGKLLQPDPIPHQKAAALMPPFILTHTFPCVSL